MNLIKRGIMKYIILLLVLISTAFAGDREFFTENLLIGRTLNENVDITIKQLANSPKIRYNATTDKFQIANDGTTFVNVGSEEAIALKQNLLTNSAGLRSALTDETGTGAAVFGTSPTLASPAITTPTGIVKGDVGLGNVDNTSDATKNAAAVTLTNKTLTSPVINTPTGIVKGDVGLGNVDNTSDASKPVSSATQTALNLKANLAGPTFTGNVTVPDQTASAGTDYAVNAQYVDAAIAGVVAGGVNDASTVAKGIIQLTGDLGGTAALPTVPGIASSSALAGKLSDETGTGLAVFNIAPSITAPLTVKSQAGIAAPLTNTNLHISGSDTTVNRVMIEGYNGNPFLSFRRSGGTQGSPSASVSGTTLGELSFFGYGFDNYPSASSAAISAVASETWTNSAQGSYLRFRTSATGAATITERMRIDGAGSVSIGSGADSAASAILDVTSTTKGFLPPRMTTTQRNAVASPATGLKIYNTTTGQDEVYNGTRWGGALDPLTESYSVVRPTLLLDFANSKVLSPLITFTRASTRTCINAFGIIATLAINQPCFDHDPTTGESLGLLIEESRTNLLTYSEDITNVAWTSSGTSETANAAIGPDGVLSFDKLIPDNLSSLSGVFTHGTVAKAASSITYTYSIFAKEAEFDRTRIYIRDTATSTNAASASVSLIDGSVTTAAAAIGTFTSASVSVKAYPNAIYRISLTFTSGTETSLSPRLYAQDSVAGTGDGTSGIFVGYTQLEVGAFATSIIPTISVAVTRSADSASITGTNFSSWYNQLEGTSLVRADSFATNGTMEVAVISDGTNNERILQRYSGVNTSGTVIIVDGGVTTSSQSSTAGTWALNALATLAFAYKLNDSNYALNGIAGTTDTSVTLPTVDRLSLGSAAGGGSTFLNGHIAQFIYYPKRLTNAEVAAESQQ